MFEQFIQSRLEEILGSVARELSHQLMWEGNDALNRIERGLPAIPRLCSIEEENESWALRIVGRLCGTAAKVLQDLESGLQVIRKVVLESLDSSRGRPQGWAGIYDEIVTIATLAVESDAYLRAEIAWQLAPNGDLKADHEHELAQAVLRASYPPELWPEGADYGGPRG